MVKARKCWAEGEKLGITFTAFRRLEIKHVADGKWASENTNLAEYVGYTLVKVNDNLVTNIDHASAAQKQFAGQEEVLLTLRKNDYFGFCEFQEYQGLIPGVIFIHSTQNIVYVQLRLIKYICMSVTCFCFVRRRKVAC